MMVGAIFFLLMVGAFSGSSNAQAPTLPGGSWTNSCTNPAYEGGILSARCNLPNGGTSRINMNLCAAGATVTNNGGTLTCSQISSFPTYPSLPGGSWSASCSPMSWSGGVLGAYCGATDNGVQILSSFFAGTCALVINSNHNLACGKAINWPGGTWSQSCTNNTFMAPGVLSASCAFEVQVKKLDPAPNWVGQQLRADLCTTLSFEGCAVDAIVSLARATIKEKVLEETKEKLHKYNNPGEEEPGKVDPAGGPGGESDFQPGETDENLYEDELPTIKEASPEEEDDSEAEGGLGDSVDPDALEQCTALTEGAAEEGGELLLESAELSAELAPLDAIAGLGEVIVGAYILEQTAKDLGTVLFKATKDILKLIKTALYEDSYITGYSSTTTNYASYCPSSATVTNKQSVLACSSWTGLPGGGYLQNCTSIATNGSMVSAVCTNGNVFKLASGVLYSGNNATYINTSFCAGPGELNNYHGMLVCSNGVITGPPGNGLIGGSWSQSCSPHVLTGPTSGGYNMFAADCAGTNGLVSWINLAMCASTATMSVVNGLLVCSLPATSGPMVPPGGSWLQTCSPISYTNSILSAYCGLTFNNGTNKISKINTALCASGSANSITASAGVLQCSGAPSNLPGGTWSQSCTAVSFKNGFLVARCAGTPAYTASGVLSTINMNMCKAGATVKQWYNLLICSGLNSTTSQQTVTDPTTHTSSVVSVTVGLPAAMLGTWFENCAPQYYNASNGLLAAVCYGGPGSPLIYTRGQYMVPTYINTSMCAPGLGINEANNLLICSYNNGASATASYLPRGNWGSYCSPLNWNSSEQTLVAACPALTTNGKPQLTGFNYSMCMPGYSIDALPFNGILVCSPTYFTTNTQYTVPGGPWGASCSPLNFNQSILTASCGGSGTGVTTLDTTLCMASSIVSVNGTLGCTATPGMYTPSAGTTVPSGNWQGSGACTFLAISNAVLYALCGLPNNGVSAINLNLCTGAGVNVVGNTLLCASGYNVPSGAWLDTCSPMSWSGGFLTAFCGAATNGVQALSTLDMSSCAVGSSVVVYNKNLQCSSINAAMPGNPGAERYTTWYESCAATAYNTSSGILTASCAPLNQPTYLNFSLCAVGAFVTNSDGVLTCSGYAVGGQNPGQSQPVPVIGTWYETCSPVSWVGSLLSAYCNSNNPPAQTFSTLDVSACAGYGTTNVYWGVENNDGNLVCTAPANN